MKNCALIITSFTTVAVFAIAAFVVTKVAATDGFIRFEGGGLEFEKSPSTQPILPPTEAESLADNP